MVHNTDFFFFLSLVLQLDIQIPDPEIAPASASPARSTQSAHSQEAPAQGVSKKIIPEVTVS